MTKKHCLLLFAHPKRLEINFSSRIFIPQKSVIFQKLLSIIEHKIRKEFRKE